MLARADNGFTWLGGGIVLTLIGLGVAASGVPLGMVAIVFGLAAAGVGLIMSGSSRATKLQIPRLPNVARRPPASVRESGDVPMQALIRARSPHASQRRR
ncbi:MAG: hypothetical protein ACYDCK_02185 [Thermoplasmatota archaeon]